jgi:hypothetical protein
VQAAWRNASPHQALGRPMKVSKEDVIGVLTAVEYWLEERDEAADLRGAMMFSIQLQGANLKGANLSGARLIGDLGRVNLEQAVLKGTDGAADMKNQSMGLMRANIVSAKLRGADLSGSDFSRADFSFSDLSGVNLAGATLVGAAFSGTDLRAPTSQRQPERLEVHRHRLRGADRPGEFQHSDFSRREWTDTAKKQGARTAGDEESTARCALVAVSCSLISALGQLLAAQAIYRVLRVCGSEQPVVLQSRRRGVREQDRRAARGRARLEVEYTWFPQRMGFIRNTLRGREPDSDRFKCDLVPGVPVGFELAATTKPYYRSTYALAYLKGKGLDAVKAPRT